MNKIRKVLNLMRIKRYDLILEKIISKKRILFNKDYRKFINYGNNEEYGKAIEKGISLEVMNTENHEFHKKMAVAYLRSGDSENATNSMRKSLKIYSEKKIKSETKSISKINKLYNTEMQYTYLGGTRNLGQVIHIDSNDIKKIYITKIIPNDIPNMISTEREIFFNESIRSRSDLLQIVTPALISNKRINEQIILLTYEKKGKSISEDLDFKEIVKLHEFVFNSLEYKELFTMLNKTELQSKSYYELYSMHSKKNHLRIIENMRTQSEEINNIDDLKIIIDKIEYYVIELEIYNKIIPEDHYRLLHGDISNENITFDVTNNNYYLIDWEFYGLGLKGIDLPNYLLKMNCSFVEIKESFIPLLFDQSINYSLEKTFFIYKLIEGYISNLTSKDKGSNIKKDIYLALNYFEELVQELI